MKMRLGPLEWDNEGRLATQQADKKPTDPHRSPEADSKQPSSTSESPAELWTRLDERQKQIGRLLQQLEILAVTDTERSTELADTWKRLQQILHIIDRYTPGYRDYQAEQERRARQFPARVRGRLARVVSQVSHLFTGSEESGFDSGQSTVQSEMEKVIQEALDDVRTMRVLYGEAYRELAPGIRKEEPFARQLMANEAPSVISTEIFGTGITLDYQKKKWGMRRVVLDGIQNHLPADAQGKHTVIQYYDSERKRWVTHHEGQHLPDDRISKIRFADDGIGFDPKLLIYLKSTKDEDHASAGQFGEGIKMIAAAALRERLQIEFESRDWRARPLARPETYEDSRRGMQTMDTLCFEIDMLDRPTPLIGSRTTFHQPPPEFIRMIKAIGEEVLHFREGYVPLSRSEAGEVVSLEGSDLYHKGILITKKSSHTCLSYNLFRAEPNRDRDHLTKNDVDTGVRMIIQETDSPEVIEALFRRIIGDRGFSQLSEKASIRPKHRELWRQVFFRLYGENAVLARDHEEGAAQVLRKRGHQIVYVRDWGFFDTLVFCGLPQASKLAPALLQDHISSSVTLECTAEKWTEERIMLDTIQNHLPDDAGGTYADIRVKLKGQDELFPLHAVKQRDARRVEQVVFADDGMGYEYERLGLIFSVKSQNANAVGQFGEGLKMAAAAAIRLGMGLQYQSRNWQASAKARHVKLEQGQARELVFELIESMDRRIAGSRTVFTRITPEFWNELRAIEQKVLYFDPQREVITVSATGSGALSDNGPKAIFVKGLFVSDEYQQRLLFAYDFNTRGIPRDRDTLKPEIVSGELQALLSAASNPAFIRRVLKAAHDTPRTPYFEFQQFRPQHADAWRDEFVQQFGEQAVLIDTFDPEDVALAQARGYRPIALNDKINAVLLACGLPTVQDINRAWEKKIQYIDPADLDPREKAIFDFRHEIDPYLERNRQVPVKIFVSEDDTTRGFWHTRERIIAINRSQLRQLLDFVETYLHEKAHQITGASDKTREHFNYVCRGYAQLLVRLVEESAAVDQKEIASLRKVEELLSPDAYCENVCSSDQD